MNSSEPSPEPPPQLPLVPPRTQAGKCASTHKSTRDDDDGVDGASITVEATIVVPSLRASSADSASTAMSSDNSSIVNDEPGSVPGRPSCGPAKGDQSHEQCTRLIDADSDTSSSQQQQNMDEENHHTASSMSTHSTSTYLTLHEAADGVPSENLAQPGDADATDGDEQLSPMSETAFSGPMNPLIGPSFFYSSDDSVYSQNLYDDDSSLQTDAGYVDEEDDDLRNDLFKSIKLAHSSKSSARQQAARCLPQCLFELGQACTEQQMNQIWKVIDLLALDSEPNVRLELLEQLSLMAGICLDRPDAGCGGPPSVGANEAVAPGGACRPPGLLLPPMPPSPVLVRLQRACILPCLAMLMRDLALQVRKRAQCVLLRMLDARLVTPPTISSQLLPTILDLARVSLENNGDTGLSADLHDQRQEAATLLPKLIAYVHREQAQVELLPPFLELCNDPSFHVRRSCAVAMVELCQVLDAQCIQNSLLTTFLSLCEDDAWSVRKACTESFMAISCVVEPRLRLEALAPRFVSLLTDPAKWVAAAAYQNLGPFISTFADPKRTGLELVRPEGANQEAAVRRTLDYDAPLHKPGARPRIGNPEDDLDFDEMVSALISDQSVLAPECTTMHIDDPDELLTDGFDDAANNNSVLVDGSSTTGRADHSNAAMATTESVAAAAGGTGRELMPQRAPPRKGVPRKDNAGGDLSSTDVNFNSFMYWRSPLPNVDELQADDAVGVENDGFGGVSTTPVIGTARADAYCPAAAADDNNDNDDDDVDIVVEHGQGERAIVGDDAGYSARTAADANTVCAGLASLRLGNDSPKKITTGVTTTTTNTSTTATTVTTTTTSTSAGMTNTGFNNTAAAAVAAADAGADPAATPTPHWRKIKAASWQEEQDEQQNADSSIISNGMIAHETNVCGVPAELLQHFQRMLDPQLARQIDCIDLPRNCAYSLPAVALALGPLNWKRHLRRLIIKLSQCVQWKVRHSVASSLHSLVIIVGDRDSVELLVPLFHTLCRDVDEVRLPLLRNFHQMCIHLEPQSRRMLLYSLREFMRNENERVWRLRDELARQIALVAGCFTFGDRLRSFVPILEKLLQDKVAQVRSSAALCFGPIIWCGNDLVPSGTVTATGAEEAAAAAGVSSDAAGVASPSSSSSLSRSSSSTTNYGGDGSGQRTQHQPSTQSQTEIQPQQLKQQSPSRTPGFPSYFDAMEVVFRKLNRDVKWAKWQHRQAFARLLSSIVEQVPDCIDILEGAKEDTIARATEGLTLLCNRSVGLRNMALVMKLIRPEVEALLEHRVPNVRLEVAALLSTMAARCCAMLVEHRRTCEPCGVRLGDAVKSFDSVRLRRRKRRRRRADLMPIPFNDQLKWEGDHESGASQENILQRMPEHNQATTGKARSGDDTAAAAVADDDDIDDDDDTRSGSSTSNNCGCRTASNDDRTAIAAGAANDTSDKDNDSSFAAPKDTASAAASSSKSPKIENSPLASPLDNRLKAIGLGDGKPTPGTRLRGRLQKTTSHAASKLVADTTAAAEPSATATPATPATPPAADTIAETDVGLDVQTRDVTAAQVKDELPNGSGVHSSGESVASAAELNVGSNTSLRFGNTERSGGSEDSDSSAHETERRQLLAVLGISYLPDAFDKLWSDKDPDVRRVAADAVDSFSNSCSDSSNSSQDVSGKLSLQAASQTIAGQRVQPQMLQRDAAESLVDERV